MQLALGTVQFGLDYGISNHAGQVNEASVQAILALAKQHNINMLDCAAAYGNSEEVLGKLPQSQHFNIVSKIPALADDEPSLLPFFHQSIKNLKRKTIDTLLLHDVNTILEHPNSDIFCQELMQLKAQRKVKRIGISIYAPEQINPVIEKVTIDVVQAPVNILDQRFCHSDTVNLLTEHNIQMHTRSAFLQGLLLIELNKIPEKFSAYLACFIQFETLAQQLNVSKITLALAFLLQESLKNTHIEKIIVGCCSTTQLAQIIDSYHQASLLSANDINWQEFACNEQALINPSHW